MVAEGRAGISAKHRIGSSGWNQAIAVLYFSAFTLMQPGRQFVVKFPRPVLWVSFLALMGSWAPLLGAPEAKSQEEDAIPVVNSPTVTWQFNGSLERVRDNLLTILKEDGLSIKEESRSTGTFVTDLVNFDSKKFGVDVSIPPPRANANYPWLQAIAVLSGRFGLEGRLSAVGPEATRLDLKAIIEVTAMNAKKGNIAWVPRYSNGTVERSYISSLGIKLVAAPSSNSAPQ